MYDPLGWLDQPLINPLSSAKAMPSRVISFHPACHPRISWRHRRRAPFRRNEGVGHVTAGCWSSRRTPFCVPEVDERRKRYRWADEGGGELRSPRALGMTWQWSAVTIHEL